MVAVHKLKFKLREKGKTKYDLAEAMGIAYSTVTNRLNKGVFDTNEIMRIACLLKLTPMDIIEIFFSDMKMEN